jgi:hypothetical protein
MPVSDLNTTWIHAHKLYHDLENGEKIKRKVDVTYFGVPGHYAAPDTVATAPHLVHLATHRTSAKLEFLLQIYTRTNLSKIRKNV